MFERHNVRELDALIHQPVRLRLMAALSALDDGAEVDFTFLRDMLELSDGNLGSHLDKLAAAKYVTVRKTFEQRRPRTYVKLSRLGQRKFEDYRDALQAILPE